MGKLIFAFIHLAVSFVVLVQCDPDFSVPLDESGSYRVLVDSQSWLRSAPTFFNTNNREFTVTDGSLELSHVDQDNGDDVIGTWTSTALYYHLKGTDLTVKVIIKRYLSLPIVLFGQEFPDELRGTSVGDRDAVSSGFPSFYVEGAESPSRRDEELGCLAFGGIFTGSNDKFIGIWNNKTRPESGLNSGPLVLFDKSDRAIIVAPFTNFMAASVQYKSRDGAMTASWGLLGAADHVAQDTSYWTAVMYSGEGVNKLMESWGTVMRLYYNKDTSYTMSDWTNNYLGYWTDHGGYYYYMTEGHLNYEDTILSVKNHTDKINIPFRNIEYDSWFYPKGPNNGVTEWDAMMDTFPNGLKYMWTKTRWPVVAHNRWWSNATVYAKQNGGKYNFIVENDTKLAIPIDQLFWNDLMASSKMWGLVSYEQDWLHTQFNNMNATVSSLTLGRQWLQQMAQGAKRSGVFIQYCMAPSRHVLASLELDSVTQTRVSIDYLPGNDNWKIGMTSMFAYALGLAPYKDNFWTNRVQPGNPYNLTAEYTTLNVLVATLSTGPVAPSDGIGYMNVTLIMRSCNADGLILKPSRPITALNKQLKLAAYSGFRGEVWSTYSNIGGLQFGIILGADFGASDKVSITPAEAGLTNMNHPLRMFSWVNIKSLTEFSSQRPLVLGGCTKVDFCLVYATPLLKLGSSNIVLLGELDKFVPMSPQRVTSISSSTEDIMLTLSGIPKETVTMTINVDSGYHAVKCVIGEGGTAVISVAKMNCVLSV